MNLELVKSWGPGDALRAQRPVHRPPAPGGAKYPSRQCRALGSVLTARHPHAASRVPDAHCAKVARSAASSGTTPHLTRRPNCGGPLPSPHAHPTSPMCRGLATRVGSPVVGDRVLAVLLTGAVQLAPAGRPAVPLGVSVRVLEIRAAGRVQDPDHDGHRDEPAIPFILHSPRVVERPGHHGRHVTTTGPNGTHDLRGCPCPSHVPGLRHRPHGSQSPSWAAMLSRKICSRRPWYMTLLKLPRSACDAIRNWA